MSSMDSPRMLTLTVRSSKSDALITLVDRLRDAFRRLRDRQEWKDHVVGGVYTLEVTYQPNRCGWHPHVHVVIDGSYWCRKSIKAAWEEVTGDSSIIDIRAIRSKKAAARYIAKYVAKATEFINWPDHAIAEFDAAMHGARLVHTIGNQHGRKLDGDEQKSIPAAGVAALPIAYLCRLAADGSTRARNLTRRLADHNALLARAVGLPHREDRRVGESQEWRSLRERRIAALVRVACTDAERFELPPSRGGRLAVDREVDFTPQPDLPWPMDRDAEREWKRLTHDPGVWHLDDGRG